MIFVMWSITFTSSDTCPHTRDHTIVFLYYDHVRFPLVLRSPESHGTHEDGSEASVRGAVRAEPRGRREAGKGNSREFEFRYKTDRRLRFSIVECVNVKKSSGVKTVVLLESTTLHDADNRAVL